MINLFLLSIFSLLFLQENELGTDINQKETYIEVKTATYSGSSTLHYGISFNINPVWSETGDVNMKDKITGNLKLSFMGISGSLLAGQVPFGTKDLANSVQNMDMKANILSLAHKILIGDAEILTVLRPISVGANVYNSNINTADIIDGLGYFVNLLDVKIVAILKDDKIDLVIGFEMPLLKTNDFSNFNLDRNYNFFARIGSEKLAVEGFYDKVLTNNQGTCSSMTNQGISLISNINNSAFSLKTSFGALEIKDKTKNISTGTIPCTMVGFIYDFYKRK